MTRTTHYFLTLLTLLSASQIANADVMFVDTGADDFRISSITNLDVGGTLYNVTFHDVSVWQTSPTERTYNDYLANSGVTDPITFNTTTSAAAISAIQAEIVAAGVDASTATDSHFQLALPFNDLGPSVQYRIVERNSFNPLAYGTGPIPVTLSKTANFGPTVALLEFDVVGVPEPSTWALLTLAGIGFGGYQLRRRKKAVQS